MIRTKNKWKDKNKYLKQPKKAKKDQKFQEVSRQYNIATLLGLNWMILSIYS